jgi:flagellar hook-associated protein 3 FlgL
MRISEQMRISAGISAMENSKQAVDTLETEISTSDQILQPSDNPEGLEQAMRIQTYLSAVNNSLQDINSTQNWMDTSYSALNDFVNVMSSMRVLGLQAANGTLSSTDLQGLASQVQEALTEAVSIGNTQQEGEYVFGGFQVTQQPFTLSTATLDVTGTNDTGQMMNEIEPGVTIQINVPGSASFFSTGFTALKQLYTELQNGDTGDIDATLSSLDQSWEQASNASAVLSSRMQEVDTTQSRLEDFQTNLQEQYSSIVNVDQATAAVELSSAQEGYEATLTTLSKNTFQSLFDYLT